MLSIPDRQVQREIFPVNFPKALVRTQSKGAPAWEVGSLCGAGKQWISERQPYATEQWVLELT